MSPSKKREPRSLMVMQAEANAFALNVLSTVNFHLPPTPEGEEDKAMPAIHQALVNAWAAGYFAKSEEKAR